jgi:hypothetical protein
MIQYISSASLVENSIVESTYFEIIVPTYIKTPSKLGPSWDESLTTPSPPKKKKKINFGEA